mmetsp:Transcript_137029/g.241608  ORF Transcript_137029/g.241608 Transcript_137029/m.241608 type:complete len:84 (-) Transcript_137029:21-272(-)
MRADAEPFVPGAAEKADAQLADAAEDERVAAGDAEERAGAVADQKTAGTATRTSTAEREGAGRRWRGGAAAARADRGVAAAES